MKNRAHEELEIRVYVRGLLNYETERLSRGVMDIDCTSQKNKNEGKNDNPK